MVARSNERYKTRATQRNAPPSGGHRRIKVHKRSLVRVQERGSRILRTRSSSPFNKSRLYTRRVALPRRVSTSGGFLRSPPFSPSRSNRDALCAVKHLARASCQFLSLCSRLYSLSFHDLLSFSSCRRTLGSHLRALSLSSSFSSLSTHVCARRVVISWISSGHLLPSVSSS